MAVVPHGPFPSGRPMQRWLRQVVCAKLSQNKVRTENLRNRAGTADSAHLDSSASKTGSGGHEESVMGKLEQVRHRALALIKDEHRSLAAVVHALQFLAGRMQKGDQPDSALLGAIAHYLLQFPEKLHHPAEERYLFDPLRARTGEAREVLDKLTAEHAAGAERGAKPLA
ncbi:MAG TPA: hemerythrin domain-containing protein, partial [Burkholderiaceae bacterium]|nr:hemerythrin domain-containing protein [Burkholderiaceae bacterium]